MAIKGPKSLYTRFLLITILPMVLVQIVTSYIFYERHWASLSRNMISALTGEVASIISEAEQLSNPEKPSFLIKNQQYHGMYVSVENGAKLNLYKNVNHDYPDLIASLKTKTKAKFALFREPFDRLKFSVQVGDDVLHISFSDKRIANPSTYIFILWMVGSSILLMVVSILFLKNQVRSILYLTKAAESFGKGDDKDDFKPQGAKEIRSAGIAFIEMKERIKRLIDTRTQMLAGVSHDLKTILTRMKLITTMLTDKDRKQSLEQEVDEMSKMIEGYLSFAQVESQNEFSEPIQEVTLKNFIDGIVQKFKNFPNKFSTDIPDNILLHIRPEYFKRAINNLIDNAIKYGKTIQISASLRNEAAIISIDDDGPGIPDNKLDQVFQPFYRLDESRNSETGGVGLGLSIARDIINKHGGDIKLSRSELGGLKATIILPK